MRVRRSVLPLAQAVGQAFFDHVQAHMDEIGPLRDYRVKLESDTELWEYVGETFGIWVPREACCHGHHAPFDAFAHAYFARDQVAIWKAARGLGGKTVQLALLSLTEAVSLGAGVTLLGGSGEQAQRVLAYMQGEDTNFEAAFWDAEKAPRELIRRDVGRRTSLKNRGWIHALMASTRSVRGPHPQRLRLDEADETTQEIVEAALGQPQAKIDPDGTRVPAQVVLSSTWHIAQGTMTWLLKKEGPAKGWPVFEWCYHESMANGKGWLDQATVDEKRATMTRRSFLVECDLQEPNPEARIFQPETINMLFGQKGLGSFDFTDEWVGEVRLEDPQPGALYGTGTDWAKDVDWTWILTYRADQDPCELVAFARWGRMPWPEIGKKLDRRVEAYGGLSVHDATGVGKVVGDHLTVHSIPWDFVGRKRSDLLADYILGCEQGKLVNPDVALIRSAHEFAGGEDIWGPKHLPDEIAAAACAWKAVQEVRGADLASATKAYLKARRRRRGSLEEG